MDITIWGVNRCAQLMEPYQEEILKTLKSKFTQYNFKFGNRKEFLKNTNTEIDSSINLMPEQEYFVPVAPKCLGNYVETAEGEAKEYIEKIMNYYKSQNQSSPSFFWEDSSMQERGYQMLTDECMGYYEILEKTAPNLLVGYSQGGLVTKYLAWLDKNVFKKNVIMGIITVSGALFGSPLANPANKENIFSCIVEILKMVLDAEFEIEELHSSWIEKKLMEVSHEILDLIIDEIGEHYDFILLILNEILKICAELGISGSITDILKSIINWVGGVQNDPNDAFFDLNILRLKDEYSVMSCANNQTAVKTPSASVMSCSSDITDFLEKLLHINAEHIISTAIIKTAESELLKNTSTSNKLKNKELSSTIYNASNKLVKLKEEFIQENPNKLDEIKENIQTDPEVDKIIKETSVKIKFLYDNDFMVEQIPTPTGNTIIDNIVNMHTNGIKELNIPALANDLVIPSTYQLGCYGSDMNPNVNIANEIANHITGGSVDNDAGQANVNYIINNLIYLMSL